MKIISKEKFCNKLKNLLIELQYFLPEDVLKSIKNAWLKERNSLAKEVLQKILENAKISSVLKLPLCQDTGIPQIFLEIGEQYFFDFDIREAIRETVNEVYNTEKLRLSCVEDPLLRNKNLHCYTLYTEFVKSDETKISVIIRGGGSENMSTNTNFLPNTDIEEIKNFITDTVIKMLPYTCPPVVVGIGIGGTFEYSSYLAKKSLLRKIGERNKNFFYAKLEKELYEKINSSGIGVLGLGGDTSVLDVFILSNETHIASLPISIVLQCHSFRRGSVII